MIDQCSACGAIPVSTGGKFCQWCLELSHYDRILLTNLRNIERALGQIAERLPDLSKWS